MFQPKGLDKDPWVETSCRLINSCVLLISEFHYYINATMSLYSIINLVCVRSTQIIDLNRQYCNDYLQVVNNRRVFGGGRLVFCTWCKPIIKC